jgi:mRNA-degrading endonuclease RelE of RelBE toxin-antitoxin system
LDDRYSARRGSYRIDDERTVTVVDVDHRSGVYKPH